MREFVNVKKAQFLLEMSKSDLKELVFDASEEDQEGDRYSWSNYYKGLQQYFKRVVQQNGTYLIDYKFSKGGTYGRQYAKGFGLQTLQNDIRGFLTDSENYLDFDMCNAHFTILSSICKKHEIKAVWVDHYIKTRDEQLKTHNLTKTDFIVLLNSDYYKTSNWYAIRLREELTTIKQAILSLYPELETDNTKNPVSSKVNKLLCKYENEILLKAIKQLQHGEVYTLCFDGFLTQDKTITVEKLNEVCSEDGVKWAIKPASKTDFGMPDDFIPTATVTDNEYSQRKEEFEETNCMTLKPLSFCRKMDGEWYDYSFSDFRMIHGTGAAICNPFHPEGKKKDFLDIWIKDANRLAYKQRDFYPYNKNPPDTLPNDVLNTFVPFSRNGNENDVDGAYLDMVKKLIYCLAEEDEEMAEYLTNWIGHMFQYPEQLPETVIVLKGQSGCGKDTLVELLEKIINNPKYIIRTDAPEDIFGTFNALAENKLVVQINEQSNSNAVEYLEKIKNFATATTMNIQNKGRETRVVKSYIRLIISSNNTKPVVKDADDRRYCVMETTNTLKQKAAFFIPFTDGMKRDSTMNAVYNYFNNLDLREFSTRKFPIGKLGRILQADSVNPVVSYIYEICQKHPAGAFLNNKNELLMPVTELRTDFIRWATEKGESHEHWSKQKRFKMEILQIKTDIDYGKLVKIKGKPIRMVIINYEVAKAHLKEVYFSNEDDEVEEQELTPVYAMDSDSEEDEL